MPGPLLGSFTSSSSVSKAACLGVMMISGLQRKKPSLGGEVTCPQGLLAQSQSQESCPLRLIPVSLKLPFLRCVRGPCLQAGQTELRQKAGVPDGQGCLATAPVLPRGIKSSLCFTLGLGRRRCRTSLTISQLMVLSPRDCLF